MTAVMPRSPLGVPAPATLMAMALGEAAVAWAESGWSVFPIVPRGKTPYATGEFCGRSDEHVCGFHCGTTDTGAVSDWWRVHPDSNIGITHREAVVTDEDRLGALTEAGVILPRCPWAMTGRAGGGRHFFLRAPVGWPGLDGDAVKVTYRLPAIEVKGFVKGYVVAAPSVHASGTRYELRMGGHVPVLPAAILERLVEVTRVGPPRGEGVITIVPGGYSLPERVDVGRYQAILHYTAHLYNRHFTVAEMWPLVLSHLAPRFTTPLSQREIRDRFDRVVKDLPKNLGAARGPGPAEPPASLEDAALSEFDSTPVEWLWESWLPRGVVTVMDGNPGVSKSTLVADLVARITSGRNWPDGSAGTGSPARAMWITTEDDPGRVLRPRLEAAGGDPALVRFVTSEVIFPSGRTAFQELVVRRATEPLGLALVILDPLYSHIDAGVRTIADAEMRKGVMNPLSATAEAAGVAILVVRHFSKDTAASPINRGAGSLGGIVGAARSLWTVVLDPDDDAGETKVVGVSKLNYARIKPAWRYRVAERVPPGWVTGSVPVIEWIGPSLTSIESVLSAGPNAPDAKRALEELLADGPLAAAAVEARMKSRGFGRAATKGAKAQLGVLSAKEGMTGGWVWRMPDAEGVEDAEGVSRPSEPTPSKGRPAPSVNGTSAEEVGLGRDSVLSPSTSSKRSKGSVPPPLPRPTPSLADATGMNVEGSPEAGSVLTVVPTDPTGWANPCHWYGDHQSKHRQTPSGWTCDACYPEEEPSA